jgi:ubiquinone/menaquinone biosynthesis C-methylase UbiE
MLAEARRKPGAEAIDFQLHDLHEPLPFAASEFDLVISGLVLEHLQDLDAFFSEVQRVTKPGGRAVISAMHPAMFLRDSQATFTDPQSGEIVRPGSLPHQLGEMVMAAVRANLGLVAVTERSPDASFVERFGMQKSSVDWPMVVVLELVHPLEDS